MATIVISEFMDDEAVAFLSRHHAVYYDPKLAQRPAEFRKRLAAADALIVRNRTQVTRELLTTAPNVTCVGRLGVGLDNIDISACAERGIAVHAAAGANAIAVAEYVIGAMIVLMRGTFGATEAVAAGDWPRLSLIGREVSGKTLGLAGFGATAREVARRAEALGMVVHAHDPLLSPGSEAWQSARAVDQETLLATSDVLSLHIPLTDTTRDLIDVAALRRMKHGAILINAARGGVVDEAAMVDALRSGQLSGAAVDVFAEEPLSRERGVLFVGVPNLLLTPHIAGLTEESNVRVSWLVARKVDESLGDGGRARS